MPAVRISRHNHCGLGGGDCCAEAVGWWTQGSQAPAMASDSFAYKFLLSAAAASVAESGVLCAGDGACSALCSRVCVRVV